MLMMLILGLLAHFQGAITSPSVWDHHNQRFCFGVILSHSLSGQVEKLLWNDAELDSFVFHKMDVDQPQILLVPRTSNITGHMLQSIWLLSQANYHIHIIWVEGFLTSLPFNPSILYIHYWQWWKEYKTLTITWCVRVIIHLSKHKTVKKMTQIEVNKLSGGKKLLE